MLGGDESQSGEGLGRSPRRGAVNPDPEEKNGCRRRLSGKASWRRRRRRLGKRRRNGRLLKGKGSKLEYKTGAARDMRQKGSNYRCCLPALAGFARPQSASPDGSDTMGRFLRNSTPPSGIFGYIPLASNRSSEECKLGSRLGVGSFVPIGFSVSGLLRPKACSVVSARGWLQDILTLPLTLPLTHLFVPSLFLSSPSFAFSFSCSL